MSKLHEESPYPPPTKGLSVAVGVLTGVDTPSHDGVMTPLQGYGSGQGGIRPGVNMARVNETERCPSSETRAYCGSYCFSCGQDAPLRRDGKFRVHTRLTERAKAYRKEVALS